MSGIAGMFFRTGRRVERDDLHSMLRVLAHRGPDAQASYSAENVGLVHCMLRTTPESFQETLPLVDARSGIVVTADARLDNREELGQRLCISDPIRVVPNGELILAAYHEWGEQCPEHLLGDFSFVVWDPAQQHLFCARDHFGARPFYYYVSGDLFVFGSEIKALLTWPEVPRRLNEDRVADYLAERHSNKVDTFFQDIRRLPAGSAMVVGRTKVQVQTYWEPDPTREIRLSSDAAYAEQFHDLLQEAVRVRLRTAFTPGAHLSGGLDSSSIVALARDLLAAEGQDTLHTFTARFEELPSCDEGRYVEAMVKQGGFVSHVVRPGGDNLLEDLDEMLWYQDEPISWPSWVLERALFRAAREAGVRMLLSGHSGDITLSHGDGYFCELARTGRWHPLVREAVDFCELRGLDVSSFVWKEAVRPALSRSIPTPLRRLVWHRKFRGVPYNRLVHPDLDQRTSFSERAREQALEDIRLRRTQRGCHYSMFSDDWLTRSLEAGDRFSAAYGLSSTYPFFDKRLMEFGLALPPDQKLHQGLSRVVLRRAMKGMLPPLIQSRRTKVGLVPLVGRSLVHQNRAFLRAFADRDLEFLDGLVNVGYVRQKLIDELANTAHETEHYTASDWDGLWSILSSVILHRWLKATF